MRASLVASLLVAMSFAATAQQVKPGLWEIATQVGGQMGAAMAQVQEQLRGMPPDQRKMVEEMMAKQGMRMGPGGGTNMQICVTPEMARRDEVPMGQDHGCRVTNQQRTGSTMKASFTCSSPPSTGEALVGDSYRTNVTMNTVLNGKPETVTVESNARWVGADCGSVKPPSR